MTEMPDLLKAEFRAFFDERQANTEWDWDGEGGARILVDAVFDLDALVERLAAAAQTWRPIDTAPKDGTWILSCDATGHRDIIHWWDFDQPGKWHGRRPDQDPKPVWWIPLPDGPAGESEER